jgi:hypothetical protein
MLVSRFDRISDVYTAARDRRVTRHRLSLTCVLPVNHELANPRRGRYTSVDAQNRPLIDS